MANYPTAGKQFTVIVEGDTLSRLAGIAYGNVNEWPRIYDANQSTLKSGDPNLIYPGEKIFIPLLPELEKLKNALGNANNYGKNEMVWDIGGRILPVQAGRILRTFDTASDEATCTFAWVPGLDEIIDKKTAPYAYTPVKIGIGNKILISGRIYKSIQKLNIQGRRKDLTANSHTIDIVDSTSKAPYEKNQVTLLQRCMDLCKPKEVGVDVDSGVDLNEAFDRVTIGPTEKIFTHLNKLAFQRRVVLSSTPEGALFITKANTKQKPVGTIEEMTPTSGDFTSTFDGRERFNQYLSIKQTPSIFDDNKDIVALDKKVPISRSKTFVVHETVKGGQNATTQWERSKALAKALTIPFPVAGWYAPNGELWTEGTLVTVISKTLSLNNGFTFLIRSVEFIKDDGGFTAILSLIPPQVYTGEELVDPWSS